MPSIKEEDFFKVSGEYGSGVAINEYGGTYSLITAKQNDAGIWGDWSYPQRRVEGKNIPAEKAIPTGSPRMTKGQIIDVAKWILSYFDVDGSAF